MAAITNRWALHSSRLSGPRVMAVVRAMVQTVAVLFLARAAGWWPLAAAVVLAAELWVLRPGATGSRAGRGAVILERMPALLVGLSVVLIIAVMPRLASQVVMAGLYAAWQLWWPIQRKDGPAALVNLLLTQIVMFEAVFLMAAIWSKLPGWIVLGLAWAGAYFSVYAALSRRGERSAGVMAATWAVIVVEVSWVLLLWLFVYTIGGGYILVPQPALVLSALAYCFGSIFVSQREGSLSRGRLAEYLIIGLILMAIVVIGTSWRGSI